MIRAVLFDLDGVLVESYEAWFEVINATARELARPPVPREMFQACWGQGLQADIERFFPGQTEGDLERLYARHFRSARIAVHPQACAVLEALRKDGRRTAVITNTPSMLAREIVSAAGLTPDALVGSGDVPREKPAPDMVLRACELLGVTPAEALVVGDSRFDREAARAANVRFAGLGINGDETLGSLADVLRLASTHARKKT